jgi:hypothetical protein
MQSLVWMLISRDAHILLSMMNAVLVFPILAVISWSVPPCLSITLPRYTKDFTSVIGSPPTVTGLMALVLIFMSSVFFLFILRPVSADMGARIVVFVCICLCLWDSAKDSAKSSAKLRSSSCDTSVHWIPLFIVPARCVHDPVDHQEE